MAVAETTSLVKQIAGDIENGRCVLFLGSAVHAPPPEDSPYVYPKALRPPLGAELSLALADACELRAQFPKEDAKNLQRVALFFEIARSRFDLVQAIRQAVHVGKKPSPMLRALAELDFARIITTNYDQLLESALRAAGKDPRVSIYIPKSYSEPTREVYDATPESPAVYKLHGDIDHGESIVVTDEDYINFLLRMRDMEPYAPVPPALKVDVQQCTTLFVGYSLLDYNLRLLFKALRWGLDNANRPNMFSVDLSPDPLILYVWKDKDRSVRFVVENVWSFVPELYKLVRKKAIPDYEH
jgi:hypothetical protein